MNDAFIKIHPISGIIFFAAVIGFTMFFMNPVCIVMSLICALLNALIINGKRALWLTVKFLIPMIIVVVLINPVFNHRGMTIISYLPWNNPLPAGTLSGRSSFRQSLCRPPYSGRTGKRS